ncbi:hypothetical protein EXIGLDRAFT_778701 [Exidia glandulosa HHB12029]|uniref:Uncharacterized protein n=1 Tax=Exidia glandulosa HHB12029 TaxID=1314781 RepID=A0A165CES7_EXIGL|nr:hypothetical protein EXIGLDRAFT_778701 [Exidia glandulosa HHB12029]
MSRFAPSQRRVPQRTKPREHPLAGSRVPLENIGLPADCLKRPKPPAKPSNGNRRAHNREEEPKRHRQAEGPPKSWRAKNLSRYRASARPWTLSRDEQPPRPHGENARRARCHTPSTRAPSPERDISQTHNENTHSSTANGPVPAETHNDHVDDDAPSAKRTALRAASIATHSICQPDRIGPLLSTASTLPPEPDLGPNLPPTLP